MIMIKYFNYVKELHVAFQYSNYGDILLKFKSLLSILQYIMCIRDIYIYETCYLNIHERKTSFPVESIDSKADLW